MIASQPAMQQLEILVYSQHTINLVFLRVSIKIRVILYNIIAKILKSHIQVDVHSKLRLTPLVIMYVLMHVRLDTLFIKLFASKFVLLKQNMLKKTVHVHHFAAPPILMRIPRPVLNICCAALNARYILILVLLNCNAFKHVLILMPLKMEINAYPIVALDISFLGFYNAHIYVIGQMHFILIVHIQLILKCVHHSVHLDNS